MIGPYDALLLDHAKRPRNRGPLPSADREARGENPLCGDEVVVRLRLDGARIVAIAFEAEGCALCIGSASMMTEAVRGRTLAEASALAGELRGALRGAELPLPGDLVALRPVAGFPARIACALLAWDALVASKEREGAP